MNSQPTTTYRAVTDRTHVERLEDEALVYDVETDRVHRLVPAAIAVWDACARERSAASVAVGIGLTVDVVEQALDQLRAVGLVEVVDTTQTGIDRRTFAKRMGAGAAAVAGLALVTSIAAPTPAAASSGEGGGELECGPNEIVVDGVCVCAPGYVRVGGVCVRDRGDG